MLADVNRPSILVLEYFAITFIGYGLFAADVNRPSSPGVFCNYIVMRFDIAPPGDVPMLQKMRGVGKKTK